MTADARKAWAGHLAKRISPHGSGPTLVAILEALPALIDLPTKLFTPGRADVIAGQCSPLPTAQELRRLLLGHHTPNAVRNVVDDLPDWLRRRVDFDYDAARRAEERESQHRDWSDPENVLRAAAACVGHPWQLMLSTMLRLAVKANAPENLDLLEKTQ